MMTNIPGKTSTKYIIYSVIILIALVVYFTPIKIPQSVNTQARILPQKEWIIIKGNDGRLMSVYHNYYAAKTENYTLNIFERGDAVQFTVDSKLRPGSIVAAGDTIGSIYSNEIERELARLQGNLAAQKASLLMNQTGEKIALVQMAQEELTAAVKQTQLQKSILNRQKALFDKELISREQYENELTKYEIFDKNTQIARAQLDAITTGEKAELLEFIRSQISSLDREIEVYQNRKDRYHLLSPIDGEFLMNFSKDTLAHIRDYSTMVALFYVPFEKLHELKKGSEIKLRSDLNTIDVTGRVLMFDKTVQIFNKRQMVLGTAYINNTEEMILPGLVMECHVEAKTVILRRYIINFLSEIFSWE